MQCTQMMTISTWLGPCRRRHCGVKPAYSPIPRSGQPLPTKFARRPTRALSTDTASAIIGNGMAEVGAPSAPDPDALALLPGEDTEAVVLGFVQPSCSGGRAINERRFARTDEAGRDAPPPAGRRGAPGYGFQRRFPSERAASISRASVALIASMDAEQIEIVAIGPNMDSTRRARYLAPTRNSGSQARPRSGIGFGLATTSPATCGCSHHSPAVACPPGHWCSPSSFSASCSPCRSRQSPAQ